MARESQNQHPFPAESSGTQKARIKQNPRSCGTQQSAESAVDFPAVAEAKNQNEQPFVLDLADEPVITHTVFPELSKLGASQSLTNAARVIQWGETFVKELQDALALLWVELAQIAVDLGGELNSHV